MNKKLIKIIALTVLVGLGAGFSGVILTLLQQLVQAIAYGYLQDPTTSFFTEVTSSTAVHRFIVLLTCGLIGGVGWVLIHKHGKPLITIKETVSKEGATMPLATTAAHDILQTATVAMGSPLGKEVAPRELSCAITGVWLKRTSFMRDEHMRKLFLSCAAGAGLAAIYNAPLGGTLFVLETLLCSFGVADAAVAALACAIAVAISHIALGDFVIFPFGAEAFPFDTWSLIFFLIMGVVLAFSAVLFDKSKSKLPKLNRSSAKMIPVSIACFAGIGAIAMFFPLVLGNGQIGNDASLAGMLTGGEGLGYFFAKWGAVLLACLAGAYGGNIQPSIMMGGMLTLACAALWNMVGLPPISLATAAFVGGAVYLGLLQKMPITAAIFLVELTRCSIAALLPVCACLGVAVLCYMRLSSISQLGNILRFGKARDGQAQD